MLQCAAVGDILTRGFRAHYPRGTKRGRPVANEWPIRYATPTGQERACGPVVECPIVSTHFATLAGRPVPDAKGG